MQHGLFSAWHLLLQGDRTAPFFPGVGTAGSVKDVSGKTLVSQREHTGKPCSHVHAHVWKPDTMFY